MATFTTQWDWTSEHSKKDKHLAAKQKQELLFFPTQI